MAIDLVLIGLAMPLYLVAVAIFMLIVASKSGLREGPRFIVG
jgi:hypothetical protein